MVGSRHGVPPAAIYRAAAAPHHAMREVDCLSGSRSRPGRRPPVERRRSRGRGGGRGEEWSAARAAGARAVERRGAQALRRGRSPLAILRMLAHQPALLAPFLGWAAALAGRGALARRDSELLALRVAFCCRSAYEWRHHAVYGHGAGLSEAEIARIPAGAEAVGWAERDRILLNAADELHVGQQLSDATWSALRARFSDGELVEIPLVVGQYTMLSMLANATDVPVEPGLPALPVRW